MMGIPYTSTPTSLTLVVDFRPTVIPSSHPNFAELKRLAADPNTTERDIVPLLDIPTAITIYTGGEITVLNGRLFYRGSEVKNNLATIILGFVKSGDAAAADPFKKFLANCRRNPDLALVDTIYDWCVKGNLPITPDGELIAWKIVENDYRSIHSGKRGKLDHSIGKVVSEPREECDPNRGNVCSRGIHFASVEYIQSGAMGSTANRRIVAVVVNPEDITAIPTDYNLTKGRCCKLRVVGELVDKDRLNTFYGSAKVYDWSPAPAPTPPVRKVRTFTNALRKGDVVRLRDGSETTVSDVCGDVAYFPSGNAKYVNCGRTWYDDGSYGGEKYDRADDVIDIIQRAPVTPRNTAGLAVGQVWKTRGGNERTIKSINNAANVAAYPVQDTEGRLYTATGRFDSDTSVSQFDLVRLVKDVD